MFQRVLPVFPTAQCFEVCFPWLEMLNVHGVEWRDQILDVGTNQMQINRGGFNRYVSHKLLNKVCIYKYRKFTANYRPTKEGGLVQR